MTSAAVAGAAAPENEGSEGEEEDASGNEEEDRNQWPRGFDWPQKDNSTRAAKSDGPVTNNQAIPQSEDANIPTTTENGYPAAKDDVPKATWNKDEYTKTRPDAWYEQQQDSDLQTDYESPDMSWALQDTDVEGRSSIDELDCDDDTEDS
jgi:hypothetical protein